MTPLHFSVQNEKVDIVRNLLAEFYDKIDVDSRDALKKTPLHHAAARNYREILGLLIMGGADMNAITCVQSHINIGKRNTFNEGNRI